ncbi:erythroid membrane-associated protein [Rhynchocyon petersi]
MGMASASSSSLSSCLITLVFLQLPAQRSGDSSKSHLVPLGGTAELLCPLSLWPATVPTEVRWLRSPHPQLSQVVHVFRNGKDWDDDLMPEYKGRTALVRDDSDGSVTLKISKVRLEDRGQYRCQIRINNLTREGSVTLEVAVLGSDPYIHVEAYNTGWFQLVCKSVGWFPKPWAEWRDPQDIVLSSLSEDHILEEDGLFRTVVSSRVKDSTLGNVSCTIHNMALGQNKTAIMVITERISFAIVALAVILPILLLLIMAEIYIIWKQRRSREKLLYEHVMEVESLLEDHAKEKGRLHKGLKLKRDAVNAGWRRARLHFEAVTLDPDTAHPKLILSMGGRCVKLGDRKQPVPDNPQRFDFVVSVLGSERFTAGCHYWEVYVGDKTKWILGVCSDSVSRKGKVTASPANGHWLVRQIEASQYEALTSPQTPIRLREPPRCVGVFLDYEAGLLSFFSVTGRSHIFTFTHTFSGPLRPFFEPCLHDGGKNTAPLVICSELQKPGHSTDARPEGKGRANGDVSLRVDSSLLPPQAVTDLMAPWPGDLTPALQGLKVPSF